MAAPNISSFLFYDPGQHHQVSQLDPDIAPIQDRKTLQDQIRANNGILQVLSICCPGELSIINNLVENQNIVAIYVCKQHNDGERNPIFSSKVHDDMLFTTDNPWEFDGRITLVNACNQHGYGQQALIELARAEKINEQSSFISRPSVDHDDQQSSNSSSSSDTCSESGEVE